MKKIIVILLFLLCCRSISCMDSVPNEIVHMFLEHLSFKQIKAVARVSKMLNFLGNTIKPGPDELVYLLESLKKKIESSPDHCATISLRPECDARLQSILKKAVDHIKQQNQSWRDIIRSLKNIKSNCDNFGLLHIAAYYNDPELFTVLRRLGFNPNDRRKIEPYATCRFSCRLSPYDLVMQLREQSIDQDFERNWPHYAKLACEKK